MRNTFLKKCLMLFIAVAVFFSTATFTYAENREEEIRYIVLLEEPAVYSPDRPMLFSGNTERYNNELRKSLLSLQEEIKCQIDPSMKLNSEDDEESEFSYTDVLNGFTITTDSGTAEKIKLIEGVSDVFPDEVIACAENGGEVLNPAAFEKVADEAFSKANPGNEINVQYAYEKGYNGEGRTIAVVDSTINYNNSYFTLSDETSAKYTIESLSAKMAEKGMNKDASLVYKTAKVPYVYDYINNTYSITSSTSQHGTHVSGIAAGCETIVGDGKIKGIAPKAQILFFGVTKSNGSIPFSTVAAAVDDAVKLEADAINLSLGSDYGSENHTGSAYVAFRNAVKNAENAGIIVNQAAGNADKGKSTETKDIDYSVSDNNLFPHSVNVGSLSGRYSVTKKLVDENSQIYAAECRSYYGEFILSELVDCGSGTSAELSSVSLDGKVAVIKLPDDVFVEKESTYYSRVYNKKASALILVNNKNQLPDPAEYNYNIPVFFMTKAEGERLLNSSKQLSSLGKLMVAKTVDNPIASEFSSYGNSDKLDISIDYSTPGSNIYSSFGAGFEVLSGTSMATPLAAGAGILLYQHIENKFPTYTGKSKVMLAKNLLASTAKTVYEENGAIASPRKVGSGLIQLDKAMQSQVVVHNGSNQNRITLGDEIEKEFVLRFYVSNISDKPITFDSIETELSTDDYKYYETKGIYAFYGIKKLNAVVNGTKGITVQPGQTSPVSITVTLDDADVMYLEKAMINGFFIDGKVTLSSTRGEHVSVGIPFTGFYGNWEKCSTIPENELNTSSFILRSNLGICSVDCNITASGENYILPFTTAPDEYVSESPLSLYMIPQRNTILKIKADGDVIYSVFLVKTKPIVLNTFVTRIGAISQLLKKNGKVEWEFFFMSPLHNTESKAQKIKITLIPQEEKPSFGEINITESAGKKYLQVYAEGKNLSSLVCTGHNASGVEKNSDVTVSGNNAFAAFSIDGLCDASLRVYDSALNSAKELHGITAEVKDGFVSFKNNTFSPLSCTGVIAVYGDDGKMEKIDIITDYNTVIEGYHKVEKDISEYTDKDYRIFFWEDKLLKPLL